VIPFKSLPEPTLIRRLCVVTPYAPNSMGFGGIPRSAEAYLDAFCRLGIPVDFISSTASLLGKAKPDNLEHSFPGIRAFYFRPYFSKRWGIGVGFFLKIPIILRSQMVVLHGTRTMPTVLAAMLCRALGKPYVIVGHAQLDASRVARTRAKHRQLFYLTEGAVIWSVRGAKTLVLSGSAEQRTLVPDIADLPVQIIENFFDFDVDSVQPRHLGGPRTYLFVGRLESDKGVLAFSRIWRAVASPTSRLQIVGGGNGAYAGLVRAEAATDSRISCLGELPRDRVYDLMQHCSVIVLPTGLDDPVTENFGNVVVEAFIAGRPVMVSTGLHWDAYATEPAVIRFDPTPDSAAACIRAFEVLDEDAYVVMSTSAAGLASLFHISKALPKVRAMLANCLGNGICEE
jgi:glycosyltransferase involved in cell wall biosynthesis